MFRSIPVQNKIVNQKIQDRDRELHLQHLKNMKPSFNTRDNIKYISNNKKTIQLKEENLTKIEYENRLLLNKLTSIMKSPQLLRETRSSITSSPPNLGSRSLNKNFRKRQLVRITIENQMLFKRLQDKKSAYDAQELKKKSEVNHQYLKNICEYPLNANLAGKSQSFLNKYGEFVMHEVTSLFILCNKHNFSDTFQYIRSKRSKFRKAFKF